MAIQYAVNEQLNVVYVKVSGRLTCEQMVAFEAEFIADKRVKTGFRALFDATSVRASDLDPQLINVLLEMEKAHPDRFEGSRRALLFAEEMSWQLANHFADGAEGNLVVLFSVDVALVWLGISWGDIPSLQA